MSSACSDVPSHAPTLGLATHSSEQHGDQPGRHEAGFEETPQEVHPPPHVCTPAAAPRLGPLPSVKNEGIAVARGSAGGATAEAPALADSSGHAGPWRALVLEGPGVVPGLEGRNAPVRVFVTLDGARQPGAGSPADFVWDASKHALKGVGLRRRTKGTETVGIDFRFADDGWMEVNLLLKSEPGHVKLEARTGSSGQDLVGASDLVSRGAAVPAARLCVPGLVKQEVTSNGGRRTSAGGSPTRAAQGLCDTAAPAPGPPTHSDQFNNCNRHDSDQRDGSPRDGGQRDIDQLEDGRRDGAGAAGQLRLPMLPCLPQPHGNMPAHGACGSTAGSTQVPRDGGSGSAPQSPLQQACGGPGVDTQAHQGPTPLTTPDPWVADGWSPLTGQPCERVAAIITSPVDAVYLSGTRSAPPGCRPGPARAFVMVDGAMLALPACLPATLRVRDSAGWTLACRALARAGLGMRRRGWRWRQGPGGLQDVLLELQSMQLGEGGSAPDLDIGREAATSGGHRALTATAVLLDLPLNPPPTQGQTTSGAGGAPTAGATAAAGALQTSDWSELLGQVHGAARPICSSSGYVMYLGSGGERSCGPGPVSVFVKVDGALLQGAAVPATLSLTDAVGDRWRLSSSALVGLVLGHVRQGWRWRRGQDLTVEIELLLQSVQAEDATHMTRNSTRGAGIRESCADENRDQPGVGANSRGGGGDAARRMATPKSAACTSPSGSKPGERNPRHVRTRHCFKSAKDDEEQFDAVRRLRQKGGALWTLEQGHVPEACDRLASEAAFAARPASATKRSGAAVSSAVLPPSPAKRARAGDVEHVMPAPGALLPLSPRCSSEAAQEAPLPPSDAAPAHARIPAARACPSPQASIPPLLAARHHMLPTALPAVEAAAPPAHPAAVAAHPAAVAAHPAAVAAHPAAVAAHAAMWTDIVAVLGHRPEGLLAWLMSAHACFYEAHTDAWRDRLVGQWRPVVLHLSMAGMGDPQLWRFLLAILPGLHIS